MNHRKLLAFLASIGLMGQALAYSPITDGATAELENHVVDDIGEDVAEADVSVVYYVAPEKVDVKRGKTDGQGCFRTTGRTIGEIHVLVSKAGHYDSHLQPRFRLNGIQEATATRKWADVCVPVPVVLKRILNPAELIVNGGDLQALRWPATNVVLGFDLELFDWCPPHGSGKHDDLQLKYDFWRSSENWFQVYAHLTMMMTNCVDGLYLVPVDDSSKLKHGYRADPSAEYRKRFDFVYDRKTGEVSQDIPMPRDQYMVFRTRTRTNETGQVVSANYGLIFENGEFGGDLFGFRVGINPQANDTNLECAE